MGNVDIENCCVLLYMSLTYYSKGAKLFALPYREKVAMANLPRDAPQRGWSRQGEETTAYLVHDVNGSDKDLSDEKVCLLSSFNCLQICILTIDWTGAFRLQRPE